MEARGTRWRTQWTLRSRRCRGEFFDGQTASFFSFALQIVQYVAEVKKPDGDRLPQYHEAGLDSLRFQLLSPGADSSFGGQAVYEDRVESGEGEARR